MDTGSWLSQRPQFEQDRLERPATVGQLVDRDTGGWFEHGGDSSARSS